jgi:LmbE family N-acetylglucosaminyl deacetylase
MTLRIIAFGAHPDDCELKAAGVAAKWASQGHKVKFVATTNGDVGHFEMAGGPLALRRTAEVKKCAEILGIETQVLDIHDGELLPTIENRRTIARLIREWQADIVLGPRPYDYHPDHRYTGVLMEDAAVLVAAPFFVTDTPPCPRNPVILYYSDNFKKPCPFDPSIIVGIDDVIDKKRDCIEAMPSQFADRDSWAGRYLPACRKMMRRGRISSATTSSEETPAWPMIIAICSFGVMATIMAFESGTRRPSSFASTAPSLRRRN